MTPKNQHLKSFLYRNRFIIGSFLISFLVMMIGYFSRGVYPIGKRNVLTVDLYHQYAPFLSELQARLRSFKGIFYTWSGGLGTNFYALFAYYLASPVNLLLVIFPASFLTEAILLIILVKVGLAGACFHYFLRETYHRDGPALMAISSAYALSSYTMAYSWNVMWLDGIVLLPLVILGVIRVIRDKRYILYPVALGLALLTNYYIAYFICVFTALYILAALIIHQELPKPFKLLFQLVQLAGLSIIGAGVSAILSIPTYLSLQLTSAADDTFNGKIVHYFELFDYISQHFMLMPPTIRDGMPNMYASLFALIMLPIYFFARRIPLKVKFLHAALLLILLVSFNINVLNFAWHGFHYPNQLPYRNSFVYIFLILSMAYPAWHSLGEFTGKQIGSVVAALIALVILAQKLNDKALPIPALYATLAFLVIYAGVLTMGKVHRIHPEDLAIALLLTVIAELSVNTLISMHTIDTTEYLSSREGYTVGEEVDQIRHELKQIATVDDGFYRTEVIPPRTTNDGFLYQYKGLSIFASTSATKPVKFFENLGYHSNSINSYKYEGSTIVLDSLFGIKYLVRRSNFINDQLREQINKTTELEVYRNPYALPLGYLAPSTLRSLKVSGGDPLQVQNQLLVALGGLPGVLSPVSKSVGQQTNIELSPFGDNGYNFSRSVKDQSSRAQIQLVNGKDQQLYLYLDVTANQPDQGYVMIDDVRIDFNAKRSTLVDLGFVKAGANVEFNLTFKEAGDTTGTFHLYSYALNQEAFATTIGMLAQQGLQIDKYSDAHIAGHTSAYEDGVFLMTIPYDKGWRVLVDGKKVNTFAISDGLLAFDLKKGDHQIDLRFTPPGFLIGALVSAGAILALLLIWLATRKKARISVAVADSRDEPAPESEKVTLTPVQ